MSTISTAIEMQDRVSATLNRIQTTLYNTTAAFEAVDAASSRCLDMFQITSVTQEMMRYERQIDEVEGELIQANAQIERMQKETEEASKKASGLGDSFGTVMEIIGGLGIAYAVQSQIQQAIAYASDLTEVQNVVDVSFGNSAKIVDEWAKTTLTAYGINELSAKQYAGTMGAMLKSSGVAGEAVTDMSMRIAELSGDMASFYNLRAEEAFYKIRAGISGETEPLKELGINMNVCNLEAYALTQGITKTYNEMSQAEQTLLRYNYLMAVSADAQGDFTRTSGSYANQQRLLTENWTQFTASLVTGVLPILAQVYKSMNAGITFIKDNWTIILPIISGLTAVTTTFAAAWGIAKAQMIMTNIAMAAQTAGTIAYTAATISAAFAQGGLNAAIAACPVTWIIAGLVTVVSVVWAIIQAYLNLTNSTNTAFGVIVGTVAVEASIIANTFIGMLNGLIQFLYTIFVYPFLNIIEFVINAFNGGFDTFGDAVANLIGKIIGWFLSLGTVVTKIIDAIFGTDWTSGLNALQDTVVAWGKNDEAITLNQHSEGIQRIEYGAAWDAGTKWGNDVVKDIFDNNALNGTGVNEAVANATTMNDIAANTGNTAAGVDKLSNSVDISNEQLQYMRDLAEQEVINRFTTAEMKVDMSGMNNTVNNGSDLDTIINTISHGVQEAMIISAEGLHE